MINSPDKVVISTFYDHLLSVASQKNRELSEVLQDAYKLGIKYVDINSRYLSEDSLQTERLIMNSGIKIGCICHECNINDEEKVNAACRIVDKAEVLGVGEILLIPGFISENDNASDVIAEMIKYVNQVCDYASKKNITVCIEVYDDKRSPLSGEGLMYFGKNCEKLKFIFDTGNNAFWGEDAKEYYGLMKSRIVHVHLKDRAYEQNNGEYPVISVNGTKLYPCAVGYGQMDLAGTLDNLKNDNYSGILSIEHYGANDTWKYLCDSVKWLSSQATGKNQ